MSPWMAHPLVPGSSDPSATPSPRASVPPGLWGVALLLVACSAGADDPAGTPIGAVADTGGSSGTGSAPASPTSTSTPIIVTPDQGGAPSQDNGITIIETLPDGFTAADAGGYRLAAALAPGEIPPPADDCSNVIRGVVRDFSTSHPDFETFCCGVLPGIVAGNLDPGKKPTYAATDSNSWQTSGPESFAQWYATVPEVNQAYLLELYLAPQTGGTFAFASAAFFPLDDAGFGSENLGRNFHFTTEIHTRFHYAGGEVFSFEGDDDLWVFINGQLAIDLGGVHVAERRTISLDELAPTLGLELDGNYDLDLFHAERHTGESNFRLESTLDLIDCGIFVPDVIR